MGPRPVGEAFRGEAPGRLLAGAEGVEGNGPLREGGEVPARTESLLVGLVGVGGLEKKGGFGLRLR